MFATVYLANIFAMATVVLVFVLVVGHKKKKQLKELSKFGNVSEKDETPNAE